jgi:hypothetical protein
VDDSHLVTEREHIDGVVIPTDPGARGAVEDDPWRLLVEGCGVLMTWMRAPESARSSWGTALRQTGALAQQLSDVLTQARGAASTGSDMLVRLELPTGSTLRDLVPAIGGGVRGLVRDERGICGQVKLHPVAGRSAAGVGLGPLLGLLAVQVGTEMLARHQQEQKLAHIAEAVAALQQAHEDEMEAKLDSAEATLGRASAALLDRISIPAAIGLGPASHDLQTVKNQMLKWLDRWEDSARQLPSTGAVDTARMQDALAAGGPRDDHRRFPHRVAMLYRALVLDSRALVVAGAEAALQHADRSLPTFQEELARGMEKNAAVQERLRNVLWQLAAPPVTYTFPWEGGEAIALDRLLRGMAAGVSRLPDAPALLTRGDRQVLEVLRRPSGEIRVLTPGSI